MGHIPDGFAVGVFAYIRNSRGSVLLVRDISRGEKWGLPGGGLSSAELLTDALCREVSEELGVGIEIGPLFGIFSQQKSPGIVALFDARICSGTPAADETEISAYRYFSWPEMCEMKEDIKPAQFSMVRQRKFSRSRSPVFRFFT